MEQRFIVISTDGYEINTEQFTTYDKAYDYVQVRLWGKMRGRVMS